jgi:arylsulfatase A-like enzyme
VANDKGAPDSAGFLLRCWLEAGATGGIPMKTLTHVVLVLVAGLLATACRAAVASQRPNIVFILADDLGWADVAFHQGNAPTPHLDKLARESVELTQHYSAATCSPTRAGLMTGRCWSRFGILGPDNRRALPWDTITLPRALKNVGYETALMGKWHLGSKSDWGPNHFGFDHSYGSLAGGVGPWDHFYKEGEFMRTWHRNEKLLTETGHVTDLIANEAVQWIAARKGAPFFLYVPFTAVHLPLKEPAEWLARVPAAITGEVPRQYAASIMHFDDAIGRVIAALEKAGVRENTLLVFTSDNGGSKAPNHDQPYPPDGYAQGRIPGNNEPWRGQKGDLYEGGIRVPTLVSWPGRLRPAKIAQPMQIVDWMPTLCALTGYAPPRDLKWDGLNMWPHLTGEAKAPVARTLYWTTPQASAVREGDWKLIVPIARAGKAAPGAPQLFDLAQDAREKTDLAAKMPERVDALKRTLATIAKADRDAMVKE